MSGLEGIRAEHLRDAVLSGPNVRSIQGFLMQLEGASAAADPEESRTLHVLVQEIDLLFLDCFEQARMAKESDDYGLYFKETLVPIFKARQEFLLRAIGAVVAHARSQPWYVAFYVRFFENLTGEPNNLELLVRAAKLVEQYPPSCG